jgi:hypothetical protein
MDKITAALLTVVFSIAIVLIPILMRILRFAALAILIITLIGILFFGFNQDLVVTRGVVIVALFVAAEVARRVLVWIAPTDTTVIT